MKSFLITALIVYTIFFAGDYIGARKHFTRETCQQWMKVVPLWFHLLVPGPGNACLDMGYWP